MSWLLSVVNDRSSVPQPTPRAYSIVSRSVHSNSIGSLTAPTALGALAIRGSSHLAESSRFLLPNHRKPFPPAVPAGQANAMAKRSVIWKAAAVLAATVIVGACGGSPQVRSITVTFIRHAESEANASGLLDTAVPGPGLSPAGKSQAEQVAHQLAREHYDAVYASTMARAQQTAAPLAAELGEQVEVLPGIQEIHAGWLEGKPVSTHHTT